MSHVVTITLNPCIDKSLQVSLLVPDKKMHCDSPRIDPGGGGINVARGITRLGGDVTAIYFEGGEHGQILTEMLSGEQIPIIPIKIENYTRESWMVLEKSTNKQYRFIMPGPVISEFEWRACLSKLESIQEVKYIVISGSIPAGIPIDLFDSIGEIADNKKAKLIVDTSGESLKSALRRGVYMIKPNLNELASLVDAFGLNDKTLIAAVQEIISRGYCEIVVVSLGAAGAMAITNEKVCEIRPPSVKIKSTVGAGDSMVAGIVQSLVDYRSLEEAVKYGVACGTAATMNSGTELFHRKDAENLYLLMQEEFMKSLQ